MTLDGYTCDDSPDSREALALGIVGIIRAHQPVMAFLSQNASFRRALLPPTGRHHC